MLITDFTGHLALITGATGGIGQATALALANLGCSIAVHYNSASSTATDLVKKLQEKGVKAESFQADLTNYDSVRTLHKHVTTLMGHPTILFNNAGLISGPNRATDISEIDIADFETTWKANCGSAFLLTQLCMPAMVEKRWGRVIFGSSVAGFTGGVIGPHYASSKSALHGLVHWLASAYAERGITVNGVAPALIAETKMLPGSNEELAKKIPIGRLGTPDEIAATVEWMVKTGYVTNKVVGVDGGMFVQ
ncbi:hypothetical protein ACMFMG_007283 [Clarireedia jacksonii]